jgi:hypothetical protein
VATLVLGVLAIPLALTVYLGLLSGALAVTFGVIGLVATRRGRATGRGMAVAGLLAGLVGLVLAGSLRSYGMQTFRDCQDKIGHRPTTAELRECVRAGL